MRNRILGVLIAVLAVLGALNFVQAMRGRFASDHHADTKIERASDFHFKGRFTDSVFLDERFKVSEGQSLVVDVQHADIRIVTGTADEAHLTVTVGATSEARAREIFDHMKFEAHQEDDRVVLRSHPTDDWDFSGRFSIDVVAQIPVRFDLELQSTHGDVELGELEGRVALSTTHGDVRAQSVSGPSISIRSTHGDVEADALLADELEVQTTHGDIAVGTIRTARFDVTTTHSDIEIDALEGAGSVLTTHGDVSARVLSASGIEIRTTHGDVELSLPSDAAATVNLRGEHVSLGSGFSFDGLRDTEQVKGLLNGGGPEISVSTSFGEVALRTD